MQLETVTRTQGNNQALKDGSVKPRTFAFDFVEVPVLIDAFRRMVRGLEFDICEMAITTYICAKAHGKRMTAVPVFLVHLVSRLHASDHEGAARVVETRDPAIPLTAHQEVLAEVARFVGRPVSRTAVDATRTSST